MDSYLTVWPATCEGWSLEGLFILGNLLGSLDLDFELRFADEICAFFN